MNLLEVTDLQLIVFEPSQHTKNYKLTKHSTGKRLGRLFLVIYQFVFFFN